MEIRSLLKYAPAREPATQAAVPTSSKPTSIHDVVATMAPTVAGNAQSAEEALARLRNPDGE